jgi:hypothetical protein
MSFTKSCVDTAWIDVCRAEAELELVEDAYLGLVKTASWKNLWHLFAKYRLRKMWIKAHNNVVKTKKEWEDLWR